MALIFETESTGALRLTTRLYGPHYLTAPGIFRQRLDETMGLSLRSVSGTMAERGKNAYRWSPMRDRFQAYTVIGPRSYKAGVSNEDPRLPYTEYDTKPHIPPWGPGTPLYRWARRHNIDPLYVARLIASRGTKGKGYMERILKEMADDFAVAIHGAVRRTHNGF